MLAKERLQRTSHAPVRHALSSMGPHDHEVEPVLFRKERNRVCGILVNDLMQRTNGPLLAVSHLFIETGREFSPFGLDGLVSRVGRLGVRGRANHNEQFDRATHVISQRLCNVERPARPAGAVITHQDSPKDAAVGSGVPCTRLVHRVPLPI